MVPAGAGPTVAADMEAAGAVKGLSAWHDLLPSARTCRNTGVRAFFTSIDNLGGLYWLQSRMHGQSIWRSARYLLLASVTTTGAVGPECAIQGRVIDPGGAPVASAAVRAIRAGSLPVPRDSPSGGVTADLRGEFCLSGLDPGEYLIRTSARSSPPSAAPGCAECCVLTSEFVPTAYRVRVESSRNAPPVTIAMRRVPAYCVRGEVVDSSGRLRGDAGLVLSADGWSASVFNEGGRFLLTSLPAGEYRLTVTEPGRVGRVLVQRAIRVTPRMRPVTVIVR